MSKLIDKALARLRRLPADRQDAMASFILDEIEDDARWETFFTASARKARF